MPRRWPSVRPTCRPKAGPDPGRAGFAEQRRQREDRDAQERREPRRAERGRGDADVDDRCGGAERTDRAEQPDRDDGDERGEQRGGDRQHDGLAEGEGDEVSRGRAARSQKRRLVPTAIDEQAGDEQDGIPREHRELDGQQRDPAATDEDGLAGRGQDRRKVRDDRELMRWRERRPEVGLDPLDALSERLDPVHPDPVDRRERPPLHVELAGPGAGQEVGLGEHERAAGRQLFILVDPVQLERVAEPVRVVRVGSPDAHDGDLADLARVEAPRQSDRVPDAEVERLGRPLGHRRLDRRLARRRPATGRQRGVPLDVAVGRQPGEVLTRLLGVESDRGDRAGPDHEGDLAAGRGHRRRQSRLDDRIELRQVGARRRCPNDDGSLGRWRVQDRLAEAAESDGVSVERARGQQPDGADEQRERGHDHRPVGATAVDHGAPETDRSDQGRLPCAFGRHVGYRWIVAADPTSSV